MKFHILAINPGSTSTKIGLFFNNRKIFSENIKHPEEEIRKFSKIIEQKEYRTNTILFCLKEHNFELNKLSAVVGRGGLLKPLSSGTYRINEKMIKDLEEAKRGEHASNLGAIIAYSIASSINVPSFIVDPVSVDEFCSLARYSGLKELERESLSHALNTKAIAKRYCREKNKDYNKINLIVAHLGSGISVSAHLRGKMIDVTNSREEGAFSTERAGSVPCVKLAKLCFSSNLKYKDIECMLFREGGLYSYLGTKDLPKIMGMIKNGDEFAKEVIDAMIYQIAKEIGAMATVLEGEVEAILITGGMAHEPYIVNELKKRISFLAPIHIYPGEDELLALAEGAFRVLSGQEEVREYK
jgi:butyrate kinase